jgi:hypothetical protein
MFIFDQADANTKERHPIVVHVHDQLNLAFFLVFFCHVWRYENVAHI